MAEIIEKQTTAIAQQNVKIYKMFERLFGQQGPDIFEIPLKSVEDLKTLDGRLESEPEFEADLKILISMKIRGKISINLGAILADALLMKVNWNGRKNLIPLNEFKFFKTTLYRCLHVHYNSFEEYERDIKDAIKKTKIGWISIVINNVYYQRKTIHNFFKMNFVDRILSILLYFISV